MKRMDEPRGNDGSDIRRNPTIALLASAHDFTTIARLLIDANQHGYPVVVCNVVDERVSTLAHTMGAYLMSVDATDARTIRRAIEKYAEALDLPDVVFVDDYTAATDLDDSSFPGGLDLETVIRSGRRSRETVVAAVPAYNEAGSIAGVVGAAREHVNEVLVVDDGSGDDTVAVAERAGATVVEHGRNRGYGAAIKSALTAARRRDADRLVLLDGDGQHDPGDIPKLLERQDETDANIVIGSRFHDDVDVSVPRYRRVGLWIVNLLTNLSLGAIRSRSRISDTQSGFRTFDREAIESLVDDGSIHDGMGASTDVLYHAAKQDYVVEETGTSIRYDGDDTSTFNPVVHGFWLVRNIVETVELDRPFTFLGLPGLFTIAVGFVVGYWAVVHYLQTGVVSAEFGLLSTLCLFLGALLIVIGTILHSLNRYLETYPGRRAGGW